MAARQNTENYHFKELGYSEGLPGLFIKDQIQDQNGIMWFAIEAVGLCKYDGHNFTTYSFDSLSTSPYISINEIAEDVNGNLWIATSAGLYLFQKEHLTFQSVQPDSTTMLEYHTVYCDLDGKIWLGTSNGITIIDYQSDIIEHHFQFVKTNRRVKVTSIHEYPKGTFWLGTNKGLQKFIYATGQFEYIEIPEEETQKPYHNPIHIFDILDRENNIWLASNLGLFRYNTRNQTCEKPSLLFAEESGFFNNSFSSLCLDENNNIWAANALKRIVLIDKNLNTSFINILEHENRTKKNLITHLFKDKTGIIWVGTKYDGLYKSSETLPDFCNWPTQQHYLKEFSHIYLSSFLEGDHHYWLGSGDQGLIQIDKSNGTKKIFNKAGKQNTPESMGKINHIEQINERELLLSSENGLFQLNFKTNSLVRINENSTFCTLVGSEGSIWVSNQSGIHKFDSTNKALVPVKSNQPFFKRDSLVAIKLLEDTENTIWISVKDSGLYAYYPPGDKIYGLWDFGSPGNTIYDLIQTKPNEFWLATAKSGVISFSKSSNTPDSIYVNYRLDNTSYSTITADKEGCLWAGALNEISRISPSKTTSFSYKREYGFNSRLFNQSIANCLNDGTLIMGGKEGFQVFDPTHIEVSELKVPLVITSIIVNNKEISGRAIKRNEIKLSPKQNNLSIEFTLSDYNNPQRHLFSATLEGFDKNWNNLGNRNYITYNNIEPGNYTLKIKGRNEFGIEGFPSIELKVFIESPFFKKTWFKVLVALIITMLFIVFIRQFRKRQTSLEELINERTRKLEIAYKELLNKNTRIREQNRQIELHHQELEEKVKTRTHDLEIAKRKAEESDLLKSSFLANMSHEIRTPLNAITGFSKLVSSEAYDINRKQKYVNIIQSNATSLMKLVEDILDVSKIEAGQLTIHKDFFNFSNTVSQLKAVFETEIAMKKENRVTLNFESPLPTGTSISFFSDEIRIRQIFSNLLSNAIKFTDNGKIEFGYKLKIDAIFFWVSDTGIGIKKEDFESIFERFTKIEEENYIYRGTGLGLSISKSLATMLGGKIWVESEFTKGSVFYVEIPGKIEINNDWEAGNKRYSPSTLNIKGKKILIVEDERSNFALVNSFLLGTQAKITWAKNGKDALKEITKNQFDLVLLDIRLPDIDGYETFKHIRQINEKVPIIAQTAYAGFEDKRKITSSGFNDYLIKPYQKEDLYDKLIRLIQNSEE